MSKNNKDHAAIERKMAEKQYREVLSAKKLQFEMDDLQIKQHELDIRWFKVKWFKLMPWNVLMAKYIARKNKKIAKKQQKELNKTNTTNEENKTK